MLYSLCYFFSFLFIYLVQSHLFSHKCRPRLKLILLPPLWQMCYPGALQIMSGQNGTNINIDNKLLKRTGKWEIIKDEYVWGRICKECSQSVIKHLNGTRSERDTLSFSPPNKCPEWGQQGSSSTTPQRQRSRLNGSIIMENLDFECKCWTIWISLDCVVIETFDYLFLLFGT